MDVLMNGLLLAASLFAGGYCWVLSRRVQALKSLDCGLGGAIVTLTRQIELARGTLEEARAATRDNARDLNQLIARSEAAAATLKGALAAARDIEARILARPAAPPPPPPAPAAVAGAEPAAAPRAGVPNLRLAASAEEEPADDAFVAASGRAPALDDFVPKPRSLAPFDSPLRPRAPAPRAAPVPASEHELLDALTALAGGRR